MPQYKTPGVYVEEISVFPNSVAQVETAIPAFVGYTEKAEHRSKSLANKALRISSLVEFETYFGSLPAFGFSLSAVTGNAHANLSVKGADFLLKQSNAGFNLFRSVQMHFGNGGGSCYIVSVGSYSEGGIDKAAFVKGIDALTREAEPTMLVVPEAVSLPADECYAVQNKMITHCGDDMRNRIAILDIHDGYKQPILPVEEFRQHMPVSSYGVAYYPWLNAAFVSDRDMNFSYLNEAGKEVLHSYLKRTVTRSDDIERALKTLLVEADEHDVRSADTTLRHSSAAYSAIVTEMARQLNLLPPSGAMAGVISRTDNERGVWKAPANVSLSAVTSLTREVSHQEQEGLNVDLAGKSVNAIRTFPGKGILVWGARTLDGNSMDWRYINIRRTLIMLEQSIDNALKAFVFEPNNKNTWVTAKGMIENFLTLLWREGALAGNETEEAFYVRIGLGESMTQSDLDNGRMICDIGVAAMRPAEFINIRIQQKMQDA